MCRTSCFVREIERHFEEKTERLEESQTVVGRSV